MGAQVGAHAELAGGRDCSPRSERTDSLAGLAVNSNCLMTA